MGAEVLKLIGDSVYEDILEFVNLAHHSQNTKVSYEKGIRDFFRIIKNKEIEHLTLADLQIKKRDVEKFRTILQDGGVSNSTINNKVAGLRKLYIELVANEVDVKADFFKAIKKLDENVNSYDPFTVDEALKLSELALKETHNGLIKSKFILFLLDTCIRKQAALNLKWSDFEIVSSEEVKINAIDKGNKDFRAKIHLDFYNELLEIKTDSDKVFDIKLGSIDAMFPRLVKKLKTNPDRNLTIHSLRKTGVEFKYRYTGDIKVAQKAANHSDPALTFKTYIDTQDYGVYGAVSINHNQDDTILENLTLEQYKTLMKQLDKDVVMRITKTAKNMFK